MRAAIGPDLIRKLPKRHVDIRDTKLPGFIVRCRPSGASYLVALGRGQWKTIGKVSAVAPEAARTAAAAILGAWTRKTVALLGDDPTIGQRDARRQAALTLRTARSGRVTLRKFIDDHYAPWAADKRTGAMTVARLRSTFETFGRLPLAQLSGFAVEKWRTERLRSGTSPATVNRDLAALRSLFTKAVEWHFLKQHPLVAVKASRLQQQTRVRFLTRDEETRLRAALEARDARRRTERERANDWRRERGYKLLPALTGPYTDVLTPLVLVALSTGARRGELFSLTWNDVDFSAAQITVRSFKSRGGEPRPRRIPLNAEAVAVLRAWRNTSTDSVLVFPGDDGAERQEIKTSFLPVLKTARVHTFRFHDLRHTFASKLVQAGVDLNTVRELLGHSDIKMTLRYAHLAPAHLAAAVERLATRA